MTVFSTESTRSSVREAVNALNTGVVNFSSVGGIPTKQYYGDVQKVIVEVDPTLTGGTLAINRGKFNYSAGVGEFTGSPDTIGINEAALGRLSAAKVTAVLIHEMFHER